MHPLVMLARQFRFVRETQGPNKGVWVELFLKYTNNEPGDSWCCSFVSFLLSILYQGASPLKKTAACAILLAEARAKNYEVTTPEEGDLFFYVNAVGHAHHIGVVTGVNPLRGIAGNTSEDGKSSNGTGVFEHEINAHVFVRLPKVSP